MWDNFRHFSHHKHVYELKSDLKQFLEFSVLYTGGVLPGEKATGDVPLDGVAFSQLV